MSAHPKKNHPERLKKTEMGDAGDDEQEREKAEFYPAP